jgi:hypothetical protein
VLCRPLLEQPAGPASHAHEVTEVGWFDERSLPSDIDPGHRTRIAHVFRMHRGEAASYVDL